jgi:hypothetical protein
MGTNSAPSLVDFFLNAYKAYFLQVFKDYKEREREREREREKVMVFSTPLNNMSHLYRGVQFYWSRKPEYPETATVMSLTNLSHNVASSTPRHQWDSKSQLQ